MIGMGNIPSSRSESSSKLHVKGSMAENMSSAVEREGFESFFTWTVMKQNFLGSNLIVSYK